MKLLKFIPLQLTAAFLLGLLSAHFLSIERAYYTLPMAVTFAIMSMFYVIENRSYRRSLAFTYSSLIVFYFCGFAVLSEHNEPNKKNHYSKLASDSGSRPLRLVQITKTLKSTDRFDRYIAEVKQVGHIQTSGRLLLNVSKGSQGKIFRIGEKLIVKKALSSINPSMNPHQFDYKKYLEGLGVDRQVYLTAKEVLKIKNRRFGLNSWAQQFRINVTTALENSGFSTSEISMINALLLGQRTGISDELINNYSRAGAIHILAISGLHVGILLVILNLLLKPLNSFKKMKPLKLLISLIALWCFAIIAGLSPSVVRAVTMFSAVVFSLFGRRSSRLHQNLIISIFILLLIRPKFLFEIGFQLSYLAVFAIVSIQPLLNKLWRPNSWPIRYFWQLFTVSFAAQIGVLPLSLFYFHQFPGLFFLSNLVIVPLLACLLFLGIIIIILSLLESVPTELVGIFGKLIELLNNFITWVANQEAFVFQNIYFSIGLVLLSYILLVFFVHWVYRKSTMNLRLLFASALLLQSAFLYEKWKAQSTSEWVVFNIRNASLIAKKEGRKLSIFHSSEKFENSVYLLNSYISGANTKSPLIKNSLPKKELFRHKILLVDSLGLYPIRSAKNLSVLLVGSPKINIERMIEILEPDQIIADYSNYRSYVDRWEQSCERYQIPFHYTNVAGAWISIE